MVSKSAPVSAFAVYRQTKQNKKKSRKKKKKDKLELKRIPMVKAELHEVANKMKKNPAKAELHEVNKKMKTEQYDINSPPGRSQPLIKEKTLNVDHSLSPEAPTNNVTSAEVSASFKKPKKKKKAKQVSNLPDDFSGIQEQEQKTSDNHLTSPVVTLSDLESSIKTAGEMFKWMTLPIGKEEFFSSYWEKKPVHVSREKSRNYYSNILSTKAIDDVLRNETLLFGKNIDITSYTNGKRDTLNPTGRAHATVVWDYYRHGCSVRLLNPQTYHPELREMNTRLQEVFGSFVGANAYLTPPNSQGFAPHYDDIEAFVLQIEGRKMWRVYAPRREEEKLPRMSSPNFTQEEIGEPILEVLVKPGDLLYFPRGFIHQASTVPGHHSLHVTVSTYQKNSWADLLEKLVPAALATAIEEDVEFRKGLPLDAMDHIGIIHCESESLQRAAINKKLRKLFSKLFDYAPIDAAADQLAKDFIHDALPPILTSVERKCSILENGDRMGENSKLQGYVQLSLDTCIRLTRSNVLRLVSEEDEDTMIIYHSMENSLEYHGEDLQSFEIPVNYALAVEHLIQSYPDFVCIRDLPLEENDAKIQIASELWDHGLVLTERPLLPAEMD